MPARLQNYYGKIDFEMNKIQQNGVSEEQKARTMYFLSIVGHHIHLIVNRKISSSREVCYEPLSFPNEASLSRDSSHIT